MLKYLIRRLIHLIPVVVIISIVLFGLLKLMPGSPEQFMVQCDPGVRPELCEQARQEFRDKYRLDDPVPVQYVFWAGNLLQGDLGESEHYNEPVSGLVGYYIMNSVYLNVVVIVLSFLLAIPIGIISAVKQYSLFDSFWQVFSLLGISMPSFFFGILLLYLFSMRLGWTPMSGMSSDYLGNYGFFEGIFDVLHHMILPATVLLIQSLAGVIRYVRTSMLDIIKQDYIRTARSKGLSEKVIVYSHAFRNALIPVVTLVAFSIPTLFSGAVIIESIFSWPGIGRILIDSLQRRDYSVVLAMNMFYAVLALFSNLLMDLGYGIVDPRVKLN